MASLEHVDLMDLNSLLTEEERMVRDSVRKFVQTRFLPHVEEYYREGTFPQELIPEMGRLGYFGVNQEGYGCAGMSQLAYGLVSEELEAGDAGLRSVVSVQSSLAMYAIRSFGTEDQRQQWIPRLVTGEKIACFGLTEPDFGSNPGGMRTKAQKTGNGYVLNGSKMWITSGSFADVAVVWAKLEGVIRGFLVESGTPGFQQITMGHKLSFRASDVAELVFDDCEVGEDSLLPGTGGIRSPLACLTQARFGVAWGAIGSARACFTAARDYAIERKQFEGKPIASHQLVQAKLANMLTEITRSQCTTMRFTQLKQEGKATAAQMSMLKMSNTEMARAVAGTARSILGANGISGDYPVMRHMCNLETTVTYEGTTDIHKLILGKEITGIQAFF